MSKARWKSPPKLAVSILELSIPHRVREYLIGDLIETFEQKQRHGDNALLSWLWFWKQTLLSSYEYLNKQSESVMVFIFGIFAFFVVTLIALLMSGDLSTFINVPSFVITVIPAFFLGVGATSYKSFRLGVKLCVSEQVNIAKSDIKRAAMFFRITGQAAIYLGICMTVVGWIAMSANMKIEDLPKVFGIAFSISLLTIFYALVLKIICHVAEEKIRVHYFESELESSK